MNKQLILLVIIIISLCGCTYSKEQHKSNPDDEGNTHSIEKEMNELSSAEDHLDNNNHDVELNNQLASENEDAEVAFNAEKTVEETPIIDGMKGEKDNSDVPIQDKGLNKDEASNKKELEPLQVKIHLNTQNENSNIQLPNTCKITGSHWSDKLLVEITPKNNVELSKELLNTLDDLYMYANCVIENNTLQMLVPIDDAFEFKSEDLNIVGYSLVEDVLIESGYSKMKYDIIRYNKEHTQELFYTGDIVDDYLNVDIIFEEAQNQEAIEAALLDNLVGLESESQLPDVQFTWQDQYILNMYITNMAEGIDYAINFNGFIQLNGAIYYEVIHHYQGFDGLYHYTYPEIYGFHKLPKQSIIDFNLNTLQEEQIGMIKHYCFSIGQIWKASNKLIVGIQGEWGYYTFIYDYVHHQLMSEDALYVFNYEDVRKRDKYAYILLESNLMKIDMETLEVVSKVDNNTLDIDVIKYNEHTNQLIGLRYNYDKESSYLMLIDENLNTISEIAIKYKPLIGFLAYYELYWVDDEHVAIAGGEKHAINTYIYNIKSGKQINVITNEKIVSISPHYQYMIFSDLKSNTLKVRNIKHEVIAEITVKKDFTIPLYQYYDFWHDQYFYLHVGDTNKMLIMEMESLTSKYVELPYERAAILEIVDETTIRLVTNTDSMTKSSCIDW
ncbi:hypothetical protein HZI73_04065 [Vallitalea pronyensis]|uniref:Uncharacterized protein n=1 Tax=Vallitalea pronyensis TaxID=1348613 RepID=A0A8J8MH31_9FIRM|nr:hypothetical protein [Vallitalea pronyensis]QUI21515.1 hypothetical protein HZI73_04065 [Vallitalea pronyensis]